MILVKKIYKFRSKNIEKLQIKNPNSIFLFNLQGAIQNELKIYMIRQFIIMIKLLKLIKTLLMHITSLE